MALSLILGEAKLVAEQMDTKAEVNLEKIEDGFAITSIHLTLRAKISNVDREKFADLADKAKSGCPVSKLMKVAITLGRDTCQLMPNGCFSPKTIPTPFDGGRTVLYVDIPTSADILALTSRQAEACVSIYLRTTPVTQEARGDRIELKNLAKQGVHQLRIAGEDKRAVAAVAEHGVTDAEFDGLFKSGRPVIFAYHGYPYLIHHLTYKRKNHDNIHVQGFNEEGTTTTPFDMVVLNGLDRFHLAKDINHAHRLLR